MTTKREGVTTLTPGPGKSETILGRDVHIRGNLTSSGVLRIEGKVEGEIVNEGDVIVGETGVVTAKIKATRLMLGGTLNGNVEVDGRVELTPTARLRGDIKAAELIVAEGALLNGTVDMKATEKPAEARILKTA